MTEQATAKLNELRMAPRKVRLLADLIRGLDAEDAKAQLRLSNKNAAEPMLKLLNSAIANAEHNHNLDKSTLNVKIATVNDGPMLKRWKPRAFGRATPIRKKSSHVKIVLEGEKKATASNTEEAVEDKKEEESKKEEEKKTESESRKKIMRMTKDEIKEYADEEYGIELSTNDLKKEMIDQFFEELDK